MRVGDPASSSSRSTSRLDPALHRAYGERIPVVAIDGEEAFELHVDAAALRERLGTVAA